MAATPHELIETPDRSADVLAGVLATIRLSGALQFAFEPCGAWQSDTTLPLATLSARMPGIMPFHIVVEGDCWLTFDGETRAVEAGDVLVFPFADGHRLGSGRGGQTVSPMVELPPQPWSALPVMQYGDEDAERVRILCGFVSIGAMGFAPLRHAMPRLIHINTRGANDADWLGTMIRQMMAEIDSRRPGSLTMLERLTELVFLELLRLRIVNREKGITGWLAALADPALGRCLALVHTEPERAWTVETMASQSGLSRTALADRFVALLGTTPMRYVRDWRLYLASVALTTTTQPIAAIGFAAGYGTEAAFNRAFARAYGMPPAAWRQQATEGTARLGSAFND
ncbi:AraC family transcriptional regulator [Devosia sp.]|uniref:AraC family transcriptional regulator n=1 Tax=Devosia sp. TaxID=1871048 RepID=UPI002FC67912